MKKSRPTFRPHVESLEARTVPTGLVGNLVVFGDSLDDVGNVSLATGGTVPTPGVYSQGRFSNGPVWAETLAEYLGAPALAPSLAGGSDYAFGGATVSDAAPSSPGIPTVGQQVDQYLTGAGLPAGKAHTPAADDLFAVWAGANDFFNTFGSAGGPIDPRLTAAGVVSALDVLAQNGAKQFLVNNLPALGQTPFLQSLGSPALVAGANAWTAGFDAALAAGLSQFRTAHPGDAVVEEDVAGLFATIISQPDAFGFSNVTSPVGDYASPGQSPGIKNVTAADPQNYLFFDGIHPTTKAHELLGTRAAAAEYAALGVHTVTVTDTTDRLDPLSGSISLREAIDLTDALPGADSIHFDLGPGAKQITLTGGQLAVTNSVTIHGPGASKLTVSGNGASRVFAVEAGPVTIKDLTIADGLAAAPDVVPGVTAGGGIINSGVLTLDRVNFSDDAAEDATVARAVLGGAVANVGGDVTIKDGNFTGNVASGLAAVGGAVGSIFGGTLSVTGTAFSDNAAEGVAFGGGGAIGQDVGSTLTVNGAAFTGNRASAVVGADPTGANPLQGFAAGGAVVSGGGSTAAVKNSTFADGLARGGDGAFSNGNGGDAHGGAILSTAESVFGTAAASELTVRQSDFTNNVAQGGSGAVGKDGGSGLGGAVNGSDSITIAGGTYTANRAVGGVGGAGGNGGEGQGGGFTSGFDITVDNQPDVTITGATFARNLALGGGGATAGGGFGGGLEFFGGTVDLTAVTVDRNQAVGGAGTTAVESTGGGGLQAADGATVTIADGTITGNVAVGGSGPLPGSAVGGGLVVGNVNPPSPGETGFASVTVTGGTVSGNVVSGLTAVGGGFADARGSALTVKRTTFTGNRAAGIALGAGGAIGQDGAGTRPSTLSVDRATFTDNTASALLGADSSGANPLQGAGVGGAIVSGGGSRATVTRTSFTGNTARGGNGAAGGAGGLGAGGAIYSTSLSVLGPTAPGGGLTVADGSFTGNRAFGGAGGAGTAGQKGGTGGGASGAAVVIDLLTTGSIARSAFAGNRAVGGNGGDGGAGADGGDAFASSGGAVQVLSGTLSVVGSTFFNNQVIGGRGGDGGSGGNGGHGGDVFSGALDTGRSVFTPSVPLSLTLSGSTFLSNGTTGGAGGTAGSGGRGGDGGRAGGGALGVFGGTAAVTTSDFLFNAATGGAAGAGGTGARGGNASGGAIDLELSGSGSQPGVGVFTGVVVLGNAATGGAGTTGGTGGDGLGGGFYLGPTASATVRDGVILGNRALGGNGGHAGEGIGGGVYDSPGGVFTRQGFVLIFGNYASTGNPDEFGL